MVGGRGKAGSRLKERGEGENACGGWVGREMCIIYVLLLAKHKCDAAFAAGSPRLQVCSGPMGGLETDFGRGGYQS